MYNFYIFFFLLFQAVDAGGSMFVHIFGAYFGLAVSFAFGMKEKPKEHPLEGSTYQSNIFAMIGNFFYFVLAFNDSHFFLTVIGCF